MRVLLLASYCDEDGCCDELPCEECLVMCNVVDITGQYKIDHVCQYNQGREDAANNHNLDEEAARMKMKEREGWRTCDHSCEVCPDEHTCLGEEG